MAVKKVPRYTRAPMQKFAQQSLKSKGQQKQVRPGNEKDKKAVVIAQEIKFARLLSSNDKKARDRVLKNLRKWLTVRGLSSFAFTEADFMRLWKGLFYCMWMSDKPLIQEELAESLSKIVHCFKSKDVALLYTACALRTLGTEWYGIDQYRLDKFCMLVRRIIRQTFVICKEKSWDIEWIKGISELLQKILTDSKTCLGFNMHVTELFLEELSKISEGDIPEDIVTELVKPFIAYFITMDDERRIRHVMRHIFRYLIFQSDIGMDYMEKFQAWRDAGFPAGSIDAVEKIELSDEEMSDNTEEEEHFLRNHKKQSGEKPLDPRAGRVDVELPQLPFNAKQLATLLDQYKFDPSSTTKSRRQLRRLAREFTELSEGKMPLGVKELRLPKTQKKDTDTKLAAIRLLQFEKELYSDKSEKKRKRKGNGQLVQDEHDLKEETDQGDVENIENINYENTSDNSTVEVDKSELVIKKRKVNQKIIDGIDNLRNTKSQFPIENSVRLKKKENKMGKVQVQGSSKIEKNSIKGKLLQTLSTIASGADKSKEMKLRKNKVASAKMVDIVPEKKKKLPKLNTGKWDVSDNVNLVTPLTLNNDDIKSLKKMSKKSITKQREQKDNPFNKQAAWLAPAMKKLQSEKNRIPESSIEQQKINSGNPKKRVKIALQKNTAQHTSEYIMQLRKSPAIPFDANKKPLAGVLKASPIPSPINPFYKKNIM